MHSDHDQPSVPARYQLLELHGEGSLGRVWLAHDATLCREVALKELKPRCARDDEARRRFLREAQVTSQLEHPYIVPVHEVSSAGTLFYTMTFVRGRTLQDSIEELHALEEGSRSFAEQRTRLLEIFTRVCEAVAYANSRGVVHRDLKPSNIMLGAFGEVFVLDWGLAKVQEPEGEAASEEGIEMSAELSGDFTVTGQVMGTPGYMPPEQAAGQVEKIDGRSDVYALGAILFKILTGKSPHDSFDGAGLPAYLKRIIEAAVPAACTLKPKTPAALNAICARALEKDPARRYVGAMALGDDVRSWIEGQPTQAYRETLAQRSVRWLMRHQGLAQAGVIAVLTICVVSAAVIWQTWSEVRTLREVELGILKSHVDRIGDALSSSLRELRGSTNLIAHTVRINEFVHSLDDSDAELRARARRRVTDLLTTVVMNKPRCRRVALIGAAKDYQELVAVEKTPGGSVRAVPAAELKPLGHSHHFVHIAEVLQDHPTAFYLSHFRKFSAVAEQPDELILMAVEHLQTDPDCWLVMQMDYSPFFAALFNDPHFRQLVTVICDERRRTLFASALAKEVDWQAATEPFFAHPAEEELAKKSFGLNRDVLFARKLYYDPKEHTRYLGVVMLAPYHEVLAGKFADRYVLLALLIPPLLITIALVLILSGYVLKARGN
ncbi:MAG: serine/threonine-protein kinase [Gemmataceae bacterium]